VQTESTVKVIAKPGQLPGFWDRHAVFFANLLALFFGNEAQTETLAREVGEIDSYGGRLIPILNLLFRKENSLLILEREPDEHLCRYFREGLGLQLPELITLDHQDYVEIGKALSGGECEHPVLDKIREHPSHWVDGYVTDRTLSLIARSIGKNTTSTSEGSQNGNNKFMLYQYLCEHDLPVLETRMAKGPAEVNQIIAGFKNAGYSQAVIKSQIGASGIGMIKVDTTGEVEVPEYYFFEGPVLVQVWMKKGEKGVTRMRSPSVQMFLNDDVVNLYDITEQILSEASVHEGNESPPAYLEEHPGIKTELLRQAREAGLWLHSTGYRGTASVDFIMIDIEGRNEPDVYVCEINARVTGATYPSVLAHHLREGGAWLLRNLRLSEPQSGEILLDMLDRPGHLFMPGMREGVVPINFNFGEDGQVHKGQFLCLADTTERCHVILNMAEEDLPITMERVRD